MIVSIAIVAYNEAVYLPSILSDICKQDYSRHKTEILLINSNSSDATENIMLEFIDGNHGFYSCRYFVNHKGSIPGGHNIAIDNFVGDALIRIDAHASVPSDFISKNVNVLKSGEFAAGGCRPCIIDRNDKFGKVLLSAENSLFGSGVASYRRGKKNTYTSSLFCGMYRREVYEKVGKYNELLPRSEDNEMCYRMRKAGFNLCYSPDIVFFQQMRNTLGSMLKQKFLNGYWIGKTLGISPRCLSVFHFVPFLFLLSVFFSVVFVALGNLRPAALLSCIYLTAALFATVAHIIKTQEITQIILPFVFALIHLAYGLGTLIGIVIMPFWLITNRRKIK